MRSLLTFCCSLVLLSCTTTTVKSPVDTPSIRPNYTILPDGHFLTPAGNSIPVGSLPLGMSLSPDNKNILVVNSGISEQSLSLINVSQQRVVQSLLIRKSWMGSVWGPYNDYFFVTAGNENKIYRYGFAEDSAWFINSIMLGKPAPEEFISPSGVDINADGGTLYTVTRMSNEVFKLNAFDNTIIRTVRFDSPLYSCVLDEQRKLLFVSQWGAGIISVLHTDSLTRIIDIPVGQHPTAMTIDPQRTRLFVANSGENTLSVINLNTLKREEAIDVALTPSSLPGSTPNSIAFSGDTLMFVALANNNALAVVDVRKPGASIVRGYIPAGWYPTSVLTAGAMIVVANGKGNSSSPNPEYQPVPDMLHGTVSFIPIPNQPQLDLYTQRVLHNNPYTRQRDERDWELTNPIPKSASIVSPIKHVFYIIKELRSYDQVFGGLKQGNGDSTLVMYGRDVTPNHHALAEEFVLLDNFHANGHTTADGLHYAVSGYANDYVMKTWPTLYGRRGGDDDYEREGMATSSGGYLWDAAMQKGLRLRNYGLFVDEVASSRGEIIPMASGLARNTSPIYRGWDLYYYDTLRAEMWMKEFANYEKGDSLPALSIIRLPNDNTAGESQKHRSRKSYLADNDRALGKIVERISNSSYWKESAIFVLETSAFGGPDHVDAHRTVGLVISPYVKRRTVESTHYSTTSMLNTIERILGIPPMTQHDAGAMPMYRLFQPQPDLKPFQSQPISKYINTFAQ